MTDYKALMESTLSGASQLFDRAFQVCRIQRPIEYHSGRDLDALDQFAIIPDDKGVRCWAIEMDEDYQVVTWEQMAKSDEELEREHEAKRSRRLAEIEAYRERQEKRRELLARKAELQRQIAELDKEIKG